MQSVDGGGWRKKWNLRFDNVVIFEGSWRNGWQIEGDGGIVDAVGRLEERCIVVVGVEADQWGFGDVVDARHVVAALVTRLVLFFWFFNGSNSLQNVRYLQRDWTVISPDSIHFLAKSVGFQWTQLFGIELNHAGIQSQSIWIQLQSIYYRFYSSSGPIMQSNNKK